MLKRTEVDEQYKWNFDCIYKDWDTVDTKVEEVKKYIEEIKTYQGKIGESFETFKRFNQLQEKLERLFETVYFYTFALNTIDAKDEVCNQKVQEINILYNNYSVSCSYIVPELISIGKERILEFLNRDEELKAYIYPMEKLFREEEHTLSEDKEKLLSYFSMVNGAPSEIYDNLTTTDIKFNTVTFSNGEEAVITGENLSSYLQTLEKQEDRFTAFKGLFSQYKEKENTFASIYNTIVQKNLAESKAREYKNVLESFLKHNNISNEVYETLISTTKENTGPLKKYIQLRKKILGLDSYYTYDRMKPIVEFNKSYDYEYAVSLVEEACKPLGEDYCSFLYKAIGKGAVDVFETEGKRGGAYSWGTYETNPYILLNYKEKLGDVFTLAHEAGHSMHTYYSNTNQPFATHSYTIFVAEVASTLNEHLLLDYMLQKVEDRNERIYLLQMAIDGLVATFYRQTLFADFEYTVHQMAERGEAITAPILNKIMENLYMEYYGIDISREEVKHSVWARIPHLFHSPFYVYQYATSYAASSKIYKDIKETSGDEKKKKLEAYLNLLRSGGNTDPIDQLKLAGADLTEKETIIAVAKQLDKLVSQLEKEFI